MIGTIDITVNAAHPNLALDQVCGFVDSPSSFRIRNVPNKIGQWSITAVKVVVTSPDNLVHTANCVHTNDVWVGTVEGSQKTGKTIGGVQIVADGTDENGNIVTGYILGVGDYLVLNRDNTEGDTAYVLNLHDETPEQPVKADVIHLSSDWKIYDGSEWIDFGQHIEVPTKVSQLENDVGYALSTDVISDFTSLELFNQTIGNLESIISGI